MADKIYGGIMKKYDKPYAEEFVLKTNDILLVSVSDETLDYNKGVDEEWN